MITIDGDAILRTEIAGDADLTTEISGEVGVFTPILPALQEKTVNPTEEEQTVSPDSGYNGLSQVTVGAIPGDYVGSEIERDPDPIVTGNTVNIPAGFYAENTGATVPEVDLSTPEISVTVNTGLVTATVTQLPGYVSPSSKSATKQLATAAGGTITPTEAQQLAVDRRKYTLDRIYVGAIPGNYVGSQVPQISPRDATVSGKTVTVPEGYNAVQFTKSVADGSVTMPTESITATPTISVDSGGLISASVSESGTLHPTVSAGYVTSVSDGSYTVSGSNTQQLSTEAGRIITPTTAQQTAILSGKYTIGDIKVDPIPSEYIVTTDADALPKDIRAGKTAYVNGSRLTGIYNYYPYGDDAELLATYTAIDGNLKDDTTFDNWTASTTAGTIKSYTTAGTIAADMANYEYVVVWDGWVKLAFLSGATLKVMPQEFSAPLNTWILRRPTTVANAQANNFVTNTYSNSTLGYLYYYNSGGTYAMANTTYGVYWAIQAPTFTSTTADNITVTIRTPILQARCSTSYFNTARKTEIDSEHSYFHMEGKLYRISKSSSFMIQMWHRMVDDYNEARNYTPGG